MDEFNVSEDMLERMRRDMAGVQTETGDNLADVLLRIANQRGDLVRERGVDFRARAVPQSDKAQHMDDDESDNDDKDKDKDKSAPVAGQEILFLAKAIDGLADKVDALAELQMQAASERKMLFSTVDDIDARTERTSQNLTALRAYTPRPTQSNETEIDPDDPHAKYLREQNDTGEGGVSLLQKMRGNPGASHNGNGTGS